MPNFIPRIFFLTFCLKTKCSSFGKESTSLLGMGGGSGTSTENLVWLTMKSLCTTTDKICIYITKARCMGIGELGEQFNLSSLSLIICVKILKRHHHELSDLSKLLTIVWSSVRYFFT